MRLNKTNCIALSIFLRIKSSIKEIKINPRSRSAKLRAAMKI